MKHRRPSPRRPPSSAHVPTGSKLFIAAGSLVFLGAAACVFQWLPAYSLVAWVLVLFGATAKSEGARKPTALQARDTWQRWWRDTAGPGLLDELKKRTKPDIDPDKVQVLVGKLGDSAFDVRQHAQEDLVRLGVPILPLLRQVYRDPPDLEVRQRVCSCIETIEAENEKAKEEYVPCLLAVAGVVALRKSPGAAEAILAYPPSHDEDGLRALTLNQR